jgi:methylase of polypeptide subunit release factors
MSMNIMDMFSQGSSGMTSAKYRKISSALQWRQKYMKAEYYILDLNKYASIDRTVAEAISIRVKQIEGGEIKGLGTGANVWPAAHVLSKYLEKAYGKMNGMSICDLGSGTGATTILLAEEYPLIYVARMD